MKKGDRRQAEEQFAELKRLNARSRLAVVRLNREYQNWALVERCCEAAVEEGSHDLKQSAAWARLALAIAKWVPGPTGWQRRLRGYALAHWANLLKVRGDLPTADLRLEEAKRLWHAGSDPDGLLDPGRLLDIEGSLRRAQRRFGEAHSCFDQALPVSRFPGRSLINKGFTYEVMGDYGRAIETQNELQSDPDLDLGSAPGDFPRHGRLCRCAHVCRGSRSGRSLKFLLGGVALQSESAGSHRAAN